MKSVRQISQTETDSVSENILHVCVYIYKSIVCPDVKMLNVEV